MSHFATAYLPQILPKSAAHIGHTILQPHDIQIMFLYIVQYFLSIFQPIAKQ